MKSAAVLGLIAPLFIVMAVIVMAFSGGRTLRAVGWALRGIGGTTDVEEVTAVGEIAAGISQVILAIGIFVGVVVIAAFAVYSWRVLVGRGRARWLALIALVLASFVLPLNPVLTVGFLVVGTASLVFAFLPRSTAWFRYRRRLAAESKS